MQLEKLGKLQTLNSELAPLGEVGFNGFISRNQANQDVYENCIGSQKYKPSSLPQTEPCQGTPLSICQIVLKQSLVIIYGSLLWSLIADARSGHPRLIFGARLPIFHHWHQVVTHVPKMFYRCFFLKYAHFKNNLKEEGAVEQVWWGLIVTCHLIQLHFNLQRLEESHSANDSGAKAKVREEGSRDFIC